VAGRRRPRLRWVVQDWRELTRYGFARDYRPKGIGNGSSAEVLDYSVVHQAVVDISLGALSARDQRRVRRALGSESGGICGVPRAFWRELKINLAKAYPDIRKN
jgi:hypothetical protein